VAEENQEGIILSFIQLGMVLTTLPLKKVVGYEIYIKALNVTQS
jgi:hypothetical protein